VTAGDPGTFNPQRLEIARRRRGLSIIEFARLIGVTTRQVTNYENGASEPSASTWESIVATLGFAKEFYFRPSLLDLRDENATFRSLRRTTATQRAQVLAAGALAMEVSAWIEEKFNLPDVDIPDLSVYAGQPQAAAAALRSQWGLGERPISHTIGLLETHGVRVFSLAEELREVNAFSVWVESRPFVFLNTMKSAEASRFDAMHELAHLAMHRETADARETEREANAFAAAVLMPEADVLAVAPRHVTLQHIIRLKKRWGVAASALARRLHDLQIIGPWPYRTLCIELNRHGFRTNEPHPIPQRESSKVLTKVFNDLRQEGVSLSNVAAELAMPKAELQRLVFGLAMMGVTGDATRRPLASRATTTLRLVDDEK
jgi:Zn-dependent peptidase ImmA (M78 family)/plasmid maintenance system antidote protein VapI